MQVIALQRIRRADHLYGITVVVFEVVSNWLIGKLTSVERSELEWTKIIVKLSLLLLICSRERVGFRLPLSKQAFQSQLLLKTTLMR